MAMGTSQMLGCLTERLKEINSEADLTCFGQEFNPETYAIAKADMLIKGGNASGMKYGDTLSNDALTDMSLTTLFLIRPSVLIGNVKKKLLKKKQSVAMKDVLVPEFLRFRWADVVHAQWCKEVKRGFRKNGYYTEWFVIVYRGCRKWCF